MAAKTPTPAADCPPGVMDGLPPPPGGSAPPPSGPQPAPGSPDAALVAAFVAALSRATPFGSRSSRVNVWRSPTSLQVGPGGYPIVARPMTSGKIQSIAVLTQDPNLQVFCYLDGTANDYGTTVSELIQRQQYYTGQNDWTLTRQDPSASPPQFAILVEPEDWYWQTSFSLALGAPANIFALSGVNKIVVNQVIVKWLEWV